jgi:hypothetical protein
MTLDDYEALFFSLIQRAPGQPADDWEAVLAASTIPAGLGPYEIPDAAAPHHAMTQQIRSSGDPAGRIFLPTATPDDLGYYAHPISPLRDGPTAGSLVWEWRDLGGPPVVDPSSDSGSAGGTELEQRVATLEAQVARLQADAVQRGDAISLRMAEGQVLCAANGGPTKPHQVVRFESRAEPAGAWEAFVVDLPAR